MRIARLIFAALIAFALAAPNALAGTQVSTQIGQLHPVYPTPLCGLEALIQLGVSPGAQSYVVPAGGGVITSWQTATAAAAGTAILKVYRSTGVPGDYLVVGEDGPHPVAAYTTPTFSTGVHVPVRGGDIIGLHASTNCLYLRNEEPSYIVDGFEPRIEPPTGSQVTAMSGVAEMGIELLATIETDTRAPRIELSGKFTQPALRQDAVIGVVSADEAATFKATGSVSMPGAGAFSLTPATASGAAGANVELRLAIPQGKRSRIKSALRTGRRVRANIHVIGIDEAGNRSNATERVTIVKPAAGRHT